MTLMQWIFNRHWRCAVFHRGHSFADWHYQEKVAGAVETFAWRSNSLRAGTAGMVGLKFYGGSSS